MSFIKKKNCIFNCHGNIVVEYKVQVQKDECKKVDTAFKYKIIVNIKILVSYTYYLCLLMYENYSEKILT